MDVPKVKVIPIKPVVKETDYNIRINKGDKTKFYDEIKYKVELPELDPKKKQPHMQMTLAQFWEFLYKITR